MESDYERSSYLLFCLEWNNTHNRAKDFLRHESGTVTYISNHCRSEEVTLKKLIANKLWSSYDILVFLELAFLKVSSHYCAKGSCESSVKR